ncbi:hypothetical protein DES53_110115 [Roseimicrobium gellanilyticum]|uniref:SLA1 Homology Domain 1 (SHD1) protein n=1 Tax=Roseimicrobium gellanilyticum TaxID=748857 RepID=A0A366H9W8_9BACT|nr:hypothetical protein [Roseimicrobium gellanilyticum]RBP39091.1 hypothetical protein DES53_110115 [Roseimicrobium gellanilyticum]
MQNKLIVCCLLLHLAMAWPGHAEIRRYTLQDGTSFEGELVETKRDAWAFMLLDGSIRTLNLWGLIPADREKVQNEITERVKNRDKVMPAGNALSTVATPETPATPGVIPASYSFNVTWSDGSNKSILILDGAKSAADIRRERKDLERSVEDSDSANFGPSIPLDRLESDTKRYQIFSHPFSRLCNVKLVNNSAGDLADLKVRYTISYLKDGSRPGTAMQMSDEYQIPLVKRGAAVEFATKSVLLDVRVVQRKDPRMNGLGTGPKKRSYGQIVGLSLDVIHNDKVVHHYDSPQAKK